MRILFAVNSVGLGHATRSIPIIDALIKAKHEVYVLSSFRALQFLKHEFKDKPKKYLDLPDYSLPELYTEKRVSTARFFLKAPKLLNDLMKENSVFKKIQQRYQFEKIISDSRLGIYDPMVASYLFFHHFRIPISQTPTLSENTSELFFYILKNRFKYFIVPDFKEKGIGGRLCHEFSFFKDDKIKYIGISSMLKKLNVQEDIDYLFTISGPEPQRTVFEKKVLDVVKKLKGKVIVGLGKPEIKKVVKKKNVTIYGFLDRKQQQEYMNRAKFIVTRSGYTTLLELAELGKNALLVPTKGQPEQEYLSKYHMNLKTFYSVDQDELDLAKDLKIAQTYPGFKAPFKTEQSVKNFMKLVFE